MSSVGLELDQALRRLDVGSATLLEQLVRDALALAQKQNATAQSIAVDPLGWPVGHFEKYAGSLAGDDWQPPADRPPESGPVW
jgi:hypothetical protein